jgi:hypothetical protein
MSKERITELAKQLREAAAAQDPLARAVIELVKLSGEAAKESLVAADGNDMLRAQGAVRQFEKLHKELTTNPPPMRRQENS